ncbi:hypothetical protein DE146DRAFT_760683 [Phaeosphaeria sp. MPI-PUGE-AT-0046c]|nr:hypothetical protein DE146DRAFT_760683 [Phaeosphaeria sp. MPI-PUGE-AT-0046c]
MFTSAIALAVLAAFATAAPSLSPRQGGTFVAVGNKYSKTGCAQGDLIFADPIFGNGNQCQPLDRSGTGPKIFSFNTTAVNSGCKVQLYTGAGCTGTEYDAPLNQCVATNQALGFVSTNVICA